MTLGYSRWIGIVLLAWGEIAFTPAIVRADGISEGEFLRNNPPAPTGLATRRVVNGVEICWTTRSAPETATYDRDVKGYRIYRMTGPLTGIQVGWTIFTCFIDHQPVSGGTYAVKAVQKSGEVSEFSGTVSAP